MSPERLAISLFDMDRIPLAVRTKLLSGRLDLDSKPINIERSDAAIELTCDLLTAALVCDNIRSNDRAMGDKATRIYLKRYGEDRWMRVPDDQTFTVVRDGAKVCLNPAVFKYADTSSALIPPGMEFVQGD